MGSLILLNEMGDVEISWDSAQDDTMRQIIQKKMDEGIKFFVMKPMLGGMFQRRSKITSVAELDKTRIQVKDEDIERLFSEGKVDFHRRSGGEIEISHRATTAAEAAAGDTVGVRQFQGG